MTIENCLPLLACPKCKGDMIHDEKESHLTCASCHRVYPIEKGIPMLVAE